MKRVYRTPLVHMRTIKTVPSRWFTTKPTHDRLQQTADHQAVKERDEETLENDWHDNVQLLAEVGHHHPFFSDTLNEF